MLSMDLNGGGKMKEVHLDKIEVDMILYWIERNRDEGSYFAPKEQYFHRLDKLEDKLKEALKK